MKHFSENDQKIVTDYLKQKVEGFPDDYDYVGTWMGLSDIDAVFSIL